MRKPEDITPEAVTAARILTGAAEALSTALDEAAEQRAIRDSQILRLRELGWSVRDISLIAGVSSTTIFNMTAAAGLHGERTVVQR